MKLQIWNADLVPRYCDKETEVYLVEDVALAVAKLRKRICDACGIKFDCKGKTCNFIKVIDELFGCEKPIKDDLRAETFLKSLGHGKGKIEEEEGRK